MNLSAILDISTTISLKECPFYKEDMFKCFIDTYFKNKDKVEKELDETRKFELMGKYQFGTHRKEPMDPDHFYIFIGYRFLKKDKKFYPFFISVADITDEKDGDTGGREYVVNGFMTLDDESMTKPYFQNYKRIENFKNWNFTFSVLDTELTENFQVIAKITRKKLGPVAAQANWKSRWIQDP